MMKNYRFPLVFTILLVCVSCGGSVRTHEFPVEALEISEPDFHTTLPSGLTLSAYELSGPPATEPLVFVPISGTSQEEILSRRQEERERIFLDNTYPDAVGFSRFIPFGEGQLVARQALTPPPEPDPGSLSSVAIEVLQDGDLVYTADSGSISPLTPLQGLWSQGEDWILEYAHVTVIFNEADSSATTEVVGHIVSSGRSLNETFGLEETFGYQTLRGVPFFFFKLDGEIGIAYGGSKTLLGFDEVPHYACCSAAMLNPRQAQNMVAFFAQRDGVWYYVELGVYQ